MSRTISILMILAVLPWCGCQPKSETDQAAQPDTAQKETAQKTADFRPTLYLELPESCPTPDGLTLDDATGTIYLNCPNFAERDENGKKIHPSVLMAIDRDGKLTELLQYEVHPRDGGSRPDGAGYRPGRPSLRRRQPVLRRQRPQIACIASRNERWQTDRQGGRGRRRPEAAQLPELEGRQDVRDRHVP